MRGKLQGWYEDAQGSELVPASGLRATPSGTLELRGEVELQTLRGGEDYIFLRQDLLDRQIIDVHGRKWSA